MGIINYFKGQFSAMPGDDSKKIEEANKNLYNEQSKTENFIRQYELESILSESGINNEDEKVKIINYLKEKAKEFNGENKEEEKIIIQEEAKKLIKMKQAA